MAAEPALCHRNPAEAIGCVRLEFIIQISIQEQRGFTHSKRMSFLVRNTNQERPTDMSESNRPKLPKRFVQFQQDYPDVFKAYDALGNATQAAGPLDEKTRGLVKLSLAIGSGMEGAVHSHTRRALEAGCSPDEIRHAVLLGTTTLGFPSMMKAMSWVDDVIKKL